MSPLNIRQLIPEWDLVSNIVHGKFSKISTAIWLEMRDWQAWTAMAASGA